MPRVTKLEDLPEFILDLEDDVELQEELTKIVLAQRIVEVLQRQLPVDSGQLRASVSFDIEGDTITIGPTAPYARWVLTGAQPSRGRYVQLLGKRIRVVTPGAGIHPGFPENPYLDRTIDVLDAGDLDEILQDMLDNLGR